MAVQGLVCGDCRKTVGVINVAAAEQMAERGEQYVCRRCRIRRGYSLWRVVNMPRMRKYLWIGRRSR